MQFFLIKLKKYRNSYLFCLLISIILIFVNDFLLNNILSIFNVNDFDKKLLLLFFIFCSIFLLSLFIFAIFYILKNRSKYNIFIKYWLLYFFIMFIFLMILWPGIFKGDEYYLFNYILNLEFCYSQHYLTSLFYLLSLCFFPTPGTITFVQIIIISTIISYILSHFELKLNNKKMTYLLLIIFLLPPIIDNNLFTLRTSLISYFFLLIIYHFIQYFDNHDFKYLIYINILAIIVSVWKSELFYVNIAVLIYTFFAIFKKFKFKVAIVTLILNVIVYGVVQMPQKQNENYIFTAIINPLSVIINDSSVQNDLSQKDINNINSIINIGFLKENQDYQNIPAYMMVVGKNKYNKIQKQNFIKTYIKIIIYHPYKFMKARLLTYKATNFNSANENPNHTGSEYPVAQWTASHFWYFSLSDKFKYVHNHVPVSIKKFIISNLLMRYYSNYFPNRFNHLFYNVTWILILGLCYIVVLLKQRKWNDLFIMLLIIAQFPIIFMTAPASFWMYYICLYISLNFILGYKCVLCIDKAFN